MSGCFPSQCYCFCHKGIESIKNKCYCTCSVNPSTGGRACIEWPQSSKLDRMEMLEKINNNLVKRIEELEKPKQHCIDPDAMAEIQKRFYDLEQGYDHCQDGIDKCFERITELETLIHDETHNRGNIWSRLEYLEVFEQSIVKAPHPRLLNDRLTKLEADRDSRSLSCVHCGIVDA